MTAAWVILNSQLRQRWRAWLAVALLVGAFAGAVETAAAGARRTDAAYPSLLAWSRAPDVMFFSDPGRSATFAQIDPARIGRLPQVKESALLAFYTVLDPADAELISPVSTRIPDTFWHRKILAGRLPDPARAAEADISFTLAQIRHLHVGDTLRMAIVAGRGPLTTVRFRVVGIDAAPSEFPPQSGTGIDAVWATPAFYRTHRAVGRYNGIALRLRGGAAAVPALRREVSQLAQGRVVEEYPLTSQSVNTERSIHLQAVALWLVAAVLGVIGLLTLGQLLARFAFLESAEYSTLGSLGMRRGQLLAVGLGRAAAIGVGGAASGAALAVGLSPLLPLGLARIAEPHPGIAADTLVLTVGSALAVLFTVACAGWPTWRAATVGSATARTGFRRRAGRPIGALSPVLVSSVPAAIGAQLALQRGAGRTALPVRSTITCAAVGVGALSAALVFSASLGNLLATPALYGANWDARVVSLTSQVSVQPAARAVGHDGSVAAWSVGYVGAPLTIQGVEVDAIAMSPGHRGSMLPLTLSGHLPTGPGEIALGARTLAALHSHVGATIRVSLADGPALPRRIVGLAVFPSLTDTLGLGKGSVLTVSGLRRLLPAGVPAPPFDTLLLRFRPGADPNALAAQLTGLGSFAVLGPAAPTDLVNFGRVQELPLLLGGSLGLLALLTIVHLLVTSVRRRRRDFAILRTIGFTRRQTRRTVAWQAGTLVGTAAVIGIPLGIIGGRLAWQAFSHQLGIRPVPDIPVLSFAVLVPVALGLAVAIAAWPGRSAANPRPGEVLRSE